MPLTEYQKVTLGSRLVAKTQIIDPETGAPVDWDAIGVEPGVEGGYAPLDSGLLIPVEHLPIGTGTSEIAAGDHKHAQQMALPILGVTTKAEVTWDINNSGYADLWYLNHIVDFDTVPWTHFLIYGFGRANAAGASVFFRAAHSGTAAMSGAADDTSVGDANTSLNSGWITIAPALTGIKRVAIVIRGSNGTVDFVYQRLGMLLKYDPGV